MQKKYETRKELIDDLANGNYKSSRSSLDIYTQLHRKEKGIVNTYDQIRKIKRVEKPTYVYEEWIDDHKWENEANELLIKLYQAIENIYETQILALDEQDQILKHDGGGQILNISYLNKLIRVIIDHAGLISQIGSLVEDELERDAEIKQQNETDETPW